MPRPPEHENFFGLRFITNVLIAGCDIPYDIIIECSEEPRHELFLLVAGLNAFDIVQGMFAPYNGRRRNPGRHGRKRRWGPGIPDVNEAIGKRLTPIEFKAATNQLPGFRYAFRMFNAYEGVNMAAAVAELATNTLVSGVWGAFALKHETCLDFPRLSRSRSSPIVVNLSPTSAWPVNMDPLDFDIGFADNPFSTTCASSNYGLGFRGTFINTDPLNEKKVQLVLGDGTTGTWAESGLITIPAGSSASASVSAQVPIGRACHWYTQGEGGGCLATDLNVLAYGEAGWLDWLS